MFRVKIATRRFAAVATAVACVACTSSEVLTADRTSPALADTPVRTPLVDDDGWPMPADPPRAAAPYAADAQKRVAK